MPCSRCESLPAALPESGRLYLWAPLRHSTGKLVPWARAEGVPYELREADECLVLELGSTAASLAALIGMLTGEEIRGTRALFVELDAGEPGFADFPRVTTLEELAARAEGRWLAELLAQDRLFSFFQPIVRASQPTEIYAHEALLRGRGPGDELYSPGRILPAAKACGLLFHVDRAARLAAIRESVACGLERRVFINFTPTAIYDPVNCLQSTVGTIRELGLPPERFVFEVVESEEVEDVAHLATILEFYRKSGFSVALDDLGAGYASLNRMAELKPDYVKLDMKLIQGVDQDSVKAVIAKRLLDLARELDILTIVEGVERPEELAWAQEHGADFVQGYLIARPANPPLVPQSPG